MHEQLHLEYNVAERARIGWPAVDLVANRTHTETRSTSGTIYLDGQQPFDPSRPAPRLAFGISWL